MHGGRQAVNQGLPISCKDNDEKIEKALLEVKELGARKLHYGRSHEGNTKRCKLAENMLIFLWLLRYMVYDETTLSNAKLFFSPDLLKYNLWLGLIIIQLSLCFFFLAFWCTEIDNTTIAALIPFLNSAGGLMAYGLQLQWYLNLLMSDQSHR